MKELGENWPTFPKLSDVEREQVHERIDQLMTERLERQEKGERSLRTFAQRLGYAVGCTDAEIDIDTDERLDALKVRMDPIDRVLLVPRARADEIAHEAYFNGVQAARAPRLRAKSEKQMKKSR